MEDRPNEKAIKGILQRDRPEIVNLWVDATREYKKVVGPEAKDLNTRFTNVDDMIKFGNDERSMFCMWRHDGSKMSDIRKLFAANIELIEIGTQKIIAAATPAFPPASIIGTALTFVLAGCKSVSADYNVVTGFFTEMESFLKRVKILEGRLPRSKEYQACLTDVFTSLLIMCAYATKFIRKGRLKKLIANSFLGKDGDLAGARGNVEKNIGILHSATEFAILANTEESRDISVELVRVMNTQLIENSERHDEIMNFQHKLLATVREQQEKDQKNFKIIMDVLRGQKNQQDTSTNRPDRTEKKAKGIRGIISENYENLAELKMLQEDREKQTCDWLFGEAGWQTWFEVNENNNTTSLLTLHGPPGIGKSHLAAAAYDRFRKSASHEYSQKVYAAAFFCRKDFATLGSFQDIINSTILQISDQNSLVSDQINAQLAKDEIVKPKDYFTTLLKPIFRKDSNHALYIIIDAVNELETQEDVTALTQMIGDIETQELNIKVLITSRNLLPTVASAEVLVSKSKVLPDLTSIIEARLNSTDSALEGLRRLHIHVKKKIRNELEAKADGPLYISVALRYLSNIGREGAILRELDLLPNSAAGFLEKDVRQCWRRTPSNLVKPIGILLAWLTFGFDTLTLDAANALIRMYSADQAFFIEDEIEGVYGRVMRIASTTRQAGFDEPENPADQVLELKALEETKSFDDRGFMVAYRHRALRDLLSTRELSTGKHESWRSSSAAHRAMFLLCFQLIRDQQPLSKDMSPSAGCSDLHDYATKYCLRHWQNIDYKQHTREENIDILNSFAILLRNRSYFAAQIEAKGYDHSIDLLISTYQRADDESWFEKFLDDWDRWSHWLTKDLSSTEISQQPCINPEFQKYWSSKAEDCMLPLAEAHVNNWLSATEDHKIETSYYFARKAVMMTNLRKKLIPGFPDEEWKKREPIRGRQDLESIDEIYAIRSVSNLVINSDVALATATIIRACGFLGSDKFEEEIGISEKLCKAPDQRYRTNILKAEYIQLVRRQPGRAYSLIEKVLKDDTGVDPSWIARAQKMLTEFEYSKEQVEDSFRKIRSLSPPFFVPADMLLGEFQHYHYYGTPAEVLTFFKELTMVQQLTLISSQWFGLESKAHRWLQEALKEGKSVDEFIVLYEDIVGALNKESSGAAWKIYLAQLHRTFKGDSEAAKKILVEALNTPCTTKRFELFQLDTGLVAMLVVNAMSDILYEQFRHATEPVTKHVHLAEVQALLQSAFPQSVRINITSTLPHSLVVANMIRKIGSPENWQKGLQSAFDVVWTNLHDTIDWNDGINLCYLSRILAQVPSLLRDARIINSAQRSFLNETSELLKFLKRHNQEKLYDPDSERRFKEWIEHQPQFRKYVHDKKIKWDPRANDFVLLKSKKSGPKKVPEKGEEYWFNKFVETRFGSKDSDIEELTPASRCAGCDDRIALLEGTETYTCLLCTDSILCKNCFDLRMSMNQDKERHQDVTRFCCDGGRYLKSPVEGWEGIRDGHIHIKGQEPVEWKGYLDSVKTRWDEAWVEFWRN